MKWLAPFLSRKLLSTVGALALLIWFDSRYNDRLLAMDEKKAAHLTTMFMTTSGTLGAILVGYLGFQTLQTRFGLSGVAQVMAARSDSEERHAEVDEGRAKREDYAE